MIQDMNRTAVLLSPASATATKSAEALCSLRLIFLRQHENYRGQSWYESKRLSCIDLYGYELFVFVS